ncbi:hypothetical protein Vadar_033559 [Vaccinium darrowii]|uniref:Uncharacterized protein n=1 Tax=Vaccinium darrowii TaxID=229202 RepID=A0ACB7Z8B4_9ERIC|nr:hypothetical protein Vadar_033559 [Vaccinium darrowii]
MGLYSEVERFNRENENAKFVNDEETVSAYSCARDRWIGYDDVWSTTAKIQFAQGLGIQFNPYKITFKVVDLGIIFLLM